MIIRIIEKYIGHQSIGVIYCCFKAVIYMLLKSIILIRIRLKRCKYITTQLNLDVNLKRLKSKGI